MKRISWSIIAALIITLFSPVNTAQAEGTIWINPSTSSTTLFDDQSGATNLKSNSDGTRLVSHRTDGKIVTSSDSGFTWQATSLNVSASGMCLSSDGSTIFVNEKIFVNEVNSGNRKFHKSVDFGLNWTSTIFPGGSENISCSADAQKIVIEGRFYQEYHVSTDSGSTWTRYNEPSTFRDLDFYASGFQYSPDGNLLIAKGDERARFSNVMTQALLVSENNGQTWRNANLPLLFYEAFAGSQVVLAANGKIIVAAQDKDDLNGQGPPRIVSSTDKGQTWTTVSSAPGRSSAIQSSYDGGILYAVNADPNETFKSTNFGQTWSFVAPSGQVVNRDSLRVNYLTLSGDGKALSLTARNKFYTFNTNSAYLVSSDPSFTITINGQNVADGGTVNLPANTSRVEITIITSQSTSTSKVWYGDQDHDNCPAAGTCTISMPIRNYIQNISGVQTFRIEVTAPDQITKGTKNITVNQPFTKRSILDYNEGYAWTTNNRQEGVPGSGSGLPVTFSDNKDWGPYKTHFVAWSDGNTQNPRTDSFAKDLIVRGLWGVNADPGKIYIDYLAQKWGRVTLVDSAGVDTFGGSCEQSQGVCQQILPGASGSSVTAVPNEGSSFVRWSDGSTTNPRRDLNVAASFSVTAVFSAPAAVIDAGILANSLVATLPVGVKTAEIPATAALPAITLNFGGTAPTAVTVAPVANPATPTMTPFKILGSTKIVDITLTGTFNGSATVCLDGAPTDSIFHFTGGAWVELPGKSYANGQVCGVTTSFSPFTAAGQTLAPVIVYVAPTPVPYLKTLTLPQIRKSGNQLLCTPGTYNAGYTLEGVVQGSQTTLYTPVSYTFRLLFDHVAQSSLTVNTSSNSATWDLGIAPAGVLVSCAVTVTGNSLINTDASTANAASVSEALTAKTKSLSAAQNEYAAAVSANSKSYQKALVDNRTTWRANVEKDRNFYQAELIRINGLPASKVSTTLKSAALKTYLADRKKTVADYKASGPAALAARDLANKAALDTKNAAISKARSIYGSFIDSIGYGVLIP